MKKTLRMLLLVLVLCVGLVMPAAAETTDGFASDHICMVDMAGVLNEQEVTELEMMIDEIRTRYCDSDCFRGRYSVGGRICR